MKSISVLNADNLFTDWIYSTDDERTESQLTVTVLYERHYLSFREYTRFRWLIRNYGKTRGHIM